MLTVPGIGGILGITIMLKSGDMNRFESVSNYSSYCRCVSSKKISNSEKKSENNKKNRNKYLARAYVEAVDFMKRFCPQASSWNQRKVSKANQIVATKALSNEVARACYFIIKHQTDFDPEMLKPYPDDQMVAYPVFSEVNNPGNDNPQLIRRVN